MKAIDLLKESEYKWITGPDDREFDEIVLDSRKVTDKTAFVAMVGQKTDGHIHIADAAAKGAVLILVEDRKLPEIEEALSSIRALGTTGVASVPDTRKAYAEMACTYFGHPSSEMKIIGLTGTKGKTTSTYIIHEILERSGRSCGLIGTVENKIAGKTVKSKHTTPEAWEFQSLLRTMKDEGVNDCVMEVSSLGLKFKRTYGVNFEVGVFTNFLNDHVSDGEHETEEDYFLSKLAPQSRTEVPAWDLHS